jgi:predicted DsbA family dithiol-disulfide isomerase
VAFAQEPGGVDILQNIPGMDFSSLAPSAQRELATALNDQFCICGCPHTLGSCLRMHTPCRHAKRMAQLAAAEASLGKTGAEISNELSSYYLSFRASRLDLQVDDRMCQGPKSAKVTVLEFFDFECPHCAKSRPLLEKFVANNPQVRLCAVPFPLTGHRYAVPAGKLALGAREKNKYWQVYDAILENQTMLSEELLMEIGLKAGMSPAEVRRALGSEAYQTELSAKMSVAQAAGVNSTPTLFLNGRKLDLPVTPDTLAGAVADEVEWKAHGGAWAPDEPR